MNQINLIGLSGHAGCGKDTVRGMLEDIGFTGFAFADPIRAMLRELLTSNGITDNYIDKREFKESIIPELGVSYRQMAQTLGTEWGRALQSDFWLRIANSYLTDLANNGYTHFVISDVRFANEAKWVQDHGGVIWRIERPDAEPVREHISEQELKRFSANHVINNAGSISDLRDSVILAVGAVA